MTTGIAASRQQFSIQHLADLVGGTVVGDGNASISGINRLEHAATGEISFLTSSKFVKFFSVNQASAVIVSESLVSEINTDKRTIIVVPDAYRAFVVVMKQFFPPMRLEPGLRHELAVIHPSATVALSAAVSAGCVVGEGCVVNDGVQLHPNVVLYPGCTIGANTVIHANVLCCSGTEIGENCLLQGGAVIGSDGFGFIENLDGSFEKVPHVGTVKIGNNVEIGANSTIDRAAVGYTDLADGVKIDNLVHIAHNVSLGANTAVAAQAGISGSAHLGKRNRIAGQVGIVGHITTVDDVIVEAQSGVSKTISSPGAYFGSPAKEHRTTLRIEAALRQLPELLQEFRELKTVVEALQIQDSDQ
ncbi:MAG: UDP-3-O-(3-hydroxymyristoyl)glucosamine N-acyltransferase [Ignavibacteria bacterium]|nr:UDP-3-O-(3-hydroxymyristoyl)glucosamine N-acyltransferase [Ignavibacteria bacterium]